MMTYPRISQPLFWGAQTHGALLPNQIAQQTPPPTRSGLCPLQQDQLHFGSHLKGFKLKDLAYIKRHMSSYRYGKDLERMLQPETRMRAHFYKGRLLLQNYEYLNLDSQEKRRGVCHELSWDFVKSLREYFGQTYVFERVSGRSPQYFNSADASHVFILGWTPENDQAVRQELWAHPGKIPEEALVIDPSFGLTLGRKQDIEKYTIKHIESDYSQDYSAANIDHILVLPALSTHTCSTLPLGFLSDLDSKYKPADDVNPLICIGFTKDIQTGLPRIKLGRKMNGDSPLEFWDDWQGSVSRDSLLARFVRKLETDLKTPDTLTMAGLDSVLPVESLDPQAHTFSRCI